MYQGHLVNFSQPTDAQFRGLITAVGYTNSQVATNARNLVMMGKTDDYFGDKVTEIDNRLDPIETSIRKIDNALRTLISTGTGGGMTQQQVVDIVEDYHGDDIALLYSNHADQESRLTEIGRAHV